MHKFACLFVDLMISRVSCSPGWDCGETPLYWLTSSHGTFHSSLCLSAWHLESDTDMKEAFDVILESSCIRCHWERGHAVLGFP